MYPTGREWGKQIKEEALKKADTSGSTVITKSYARMVCSIKNRTK